MGSLLLKLISTVFSVLAFHSLNIFIIQFEINEVSAVPIIDEIYVMTHLAQLGYIQSSEEEINTGKRVSKEAMSRALKEYQEFANLEVSGNLDRQTMNKMQQPRCGFPDKFPEDSRNKRFAFSGYRWKKEKITFIINTTHKNKYHLPDFVVNMEMNRALKMWEQFIPLKLVLLQLPPDSKNRIERLNPDVSVSFEMWKHGICNRAFDGPDGIVAHATYPIPLKGERFIHFDDTEYWNVENSKYSLGYGANFYQTAVHELGHTLGLQHSTDPTAIMHPTKLARFVPNFNLSLDDILAIQTLYPYKKKGPGPK